MSPDQFYRNVHHIIANKKGHAAHRAMDDACCELLNKLGYSNGVALFQEVVRNWHNDSRSYPAGNEAAPMKIYLCGPINGCADAEASDWREWVKANGPASWRYIDPMARDYRGQEAEAFREIVELDKIDVAMSDVLLVNYDKPSVGTSMEVLFAWQMGKRVVVVCRPDAVISPWLRYHSHHIAGSFAEALAHLEAA